MSLQVGPSRPTSRHHWSSRREVSLSTQRPSSGRAIESSSKTLVDGYRSPSCSGHRQASFRTMCADWVSKLVRMLAGAGRFTGRSMARRKSSPGQQGDMEVLGYSGGDDSDSKLDPDQGRWIAKQPRTRNHRYVLNPGASAGPPRATEPFFNQLPCLDISSSIGSARSRLFWPLVAAAGARATEQVSPRWRSVRMS